MDTTKRWLAGVAAGLIMLLGAATAQAAGAGYPSPDQQSFDHGLAGWTPSTGAEGLCVQVLLCPVVTNSYQPTGGAINNGGFIRTSLGSLTGVGATSSGLWTSPAFTYRGVEGKRPDKLKLKLSRRSNVAALLAVTGNEATYAVKLINESGHSDLRIVDDESLAGSNDWAEIPAVSIDPSQVRLGDRYRIRIISRFVSGVQVLPGGSADYDRVRLRARLASTDGGGGTGGGGTSGAGGDGFFGRGGGDVRIVGVSQENRGHLVVKVRCAKRPKARCTARIDARLRRSGPRVTNRRTVRVRPGDSRRIELEVKARFRNKVERRRSIVVKERSKLRGDARAETRYKRVRIRRG